MNKGLNLSKSQQAILQGQWNIPLILIFYYLGEFIHTTHLKLENLRKAFAIVSNVSIVINQEIINYCPH
jgi:hypothetical protein